MVNKLKNGDKIYFIKINEVWCGIAHLENGILIYVDTLEGLRYFIDQSKGLNIIPFSDGWKIKQ